MPNTPVYTNGVKYIKIAKQDSGSVDNSIELQDLTDIRIKFSDANSAIQYNVASITEYSTYYLYNVFPLDVTSSADQEILDYTANGYKSTPQDYYNREFTVNSYNSATANSLGYLNISTGEWTLGNTPNVFMDIEVVISFLWSPDSSPYSQVSGSISLYNLNNGASFELSPVPLAQIPSFGTNSWTASGSFTPVEGDKYVVKIDTGVIGNGGVTVTLINANLYITQPYDTEYSN